MNHVKNYFSIRDRLMRITMTVVFTIAALFIVFCIILFKQFLNKSLLQYSQLNLSLLSENISAQMINIENMTGNCTSHKSIIDYFENEAETEEEALNAFKDAYSAFYYSYIECASHQYINHILICDFYDYDNFMQATGNKKSFIYNPLSEIKTSESFILYKLAPQNPYVIIEESPFGDSKEQVITIIYPISVNKNHVPAAFLYLQLSTNVITDYTESYELDPDSALYLFKGDSIYKINGTYFDAQTDFSYEKDSALTQTIYYSNWSLLQTLSPNYMIYQTKYFLIASIGVIFLLLVFGVLYSIYLQKLITKPVNKLQHRITAISEGDFSFDPDIQWPDDFGDIGRGINTMSRQIVALMDRRIADEKEKSDLEYEMLLNQMTPHFVYNTLNTIRWMALMQNADGIAEMTGALARLMKNVSKLPNTPIPVHKELELIDDYFAILKLRYGNTITLKYNILDMAIKECAIVKYTLQPLVENAIFHGIEPKQKTGLITITADKIDDGHCYIEVLDDGVGIDPARIPSLLENDSNHTSGGLMKHMGLYNVHQRLRLAFGPDYGLQIESEPGRYTKITVKLPYPKGDLYVETTDC